MRIMLVDDSKTMREFQRNILGQLGYSELEEACDGQDALSKLSAFNPELILVGWNMPNMDGLTFVKNIRQQGIKTPIIMVTTESEKARVIEAIKAGVNNYVVKPFTPEQLSERVNETMAKAAAA
ncbi:MAG: response regulator [Planctomycetes bacterium]|nr:response regulator [Planctomycetota bacterium]MCH7601265.1 response regulator [Planctomycetota bacterium]